MCQSIYAVHEGREIDTVGELLQLIEYSSIIATNDDPDLTLNDEDCLSLVNIQETLACAGFRVWQEPRATRRS